MAMVLSSRDRIQSASRSDLRPPPGHRRLRFSFQINDVKDPTGDSGPPLTPGGGGAASLPAPIRTVKLPSAPGPKSRLERKVARGRRGLPLSVLSESIEGAEASAG